MSQTITGSRALIKVKGKVIGIFDSCSWGASISLDEIAILGRFSTGEIVATGYPPVNVSCSGFRVYGNGPSQMVPDQEIGRGGNFPLLQTLLDLSNFTLEIYDRQNPDLAIAVIEGCVPQSWSGGVQSRSVSKINISYMGVLVYDESGAQTEPAGSATLPGSNITA